MKKMYVCIFLTASFICQAMEQQTAKKDVTMPALDATSLSQLAQDYEKFNGSNNPEELRKAYFGIITGLAYTTLAKRDPKIEQNATEVLAKLRTMVSPQAFDEFTHHVEIINAQPPSKDKHPYGQYYRPVQVMRESIKANDATRNAHQALAEAACKEASALNAQIKALQEQLAQKEATKQKHQTEILFAVQANHALNACTVAHTLALQQERDSLRETITKTIVRFVEAKKKLANAVVAHEKTELSSLVAELPKLIDQDIKGLWYCLHYIERTLSPDGSLSFAQAAKWKTGTIDPKELGIANYQDYQDNK